LEKSLGGYESKPVFFPDRLKLMFLDATRVEARPSIYFAITVCHTPKFSSTVPTTYP
jgi:hypothetical protein